MYRVDTKEVMNVPGKMGGYFIRSAKPGKRRSSKLNCPVSRLHVQVTAAERGEDNFRIADNSPAIEICLDRGRDQGQLGSSYGTPA